MLNIVRVSPFRSAYALRPTAQPRTAYAPAFELSQTEQAYVIEAALPGLKPEDLKITVDKNVLTISGEVSKGQEGNNEQGTAQWKQRHYSSFSRTLSLPRGANPEAISAKLENGVLRLEIAKAEQPQPRTISVNG